MSTRVGYSGGTTLNPTYHRLGDHTETVEMDFDPKVISFRELLDVFWRNHDPRGRAWSRQYRAAVFYHNEAQKREAEESLAREQSMTGGAIHTQILPLSTFYRAEDYHQKYYLRQRKGLAGVVRDDFRSEEDFVNATISARLNGYVGGYLGRVELEREMSGLGLPTDRNQRILNALRGTT
jgi:peptide-methionine (S)-S-oxide reductase